MCLNCSATSVFPSVVSCTGDVNVLSDVLSGSVSVLSHVMCGNGSVIIDVMLGSKSQCSQ